MKSYLQHSFPVAITPRAHHYFFGFFLEKTKINGLDNTSKYKKHILIVVEISPIDLTIMEIGNQVCFKIHHFSSLQYINDNLRKTY